MSEEDKNSEDLDRIEPISYPRSRINNGDVRSNGNYLRCCSSRCFILYALHAAYNMRSFIIFFILLYASYLQSRVSVTNNWSSTRLMGFGENNYCLSPNTDYDVFEYAIPVIVPTNSYLLVIGTHDHDLEPLSTTVNKPISYVKSTSSLCVSSSTLAKCTSLLDNLYTGDTLQEFNNMFDIQSRSYFPNLIYIIVSSSIILFLTVIFESNANSFNTPEVNESFDLSTSTSLNECVIYFILGRTIFALNCF